MYVHCTYVHSWLTYQLNANQPDDRLQLITNQSAAIIISALKTYNRTADVSLYSNWTELVIKVLLHSSKLV